MNDTLQFTDFLASCYEKYTANEAGEVGIALAIVDGQQFSLDDAEQEFTLQSICKPCAFLMALEHHGRDDALSHVDVAPQWRRLEFGPASTGDQSSAQSDGDGPAAWGASQERSLRGGSWSWSKSAIPTCGVLSVA